MSSSKSEDVLALELLPNEESPMSLKGMSTLSSVPNTMVSINLSSFKNIINRDGNDTGRGWERTGKDLPDMDENRIAGSGMSVFSSTDGNSADVFLADMGANISSVDADLVVLCLESESPSGDASAQS